MRREAMVEVDAIKLSSHASHQACSPSCISSPTGPSLVAARHHGPQDACVLVGQGHHRLLPVRAFSQRHHPLGDLVLSSVRRHHRRLRPLDQQRAQVATRAARRHARGSPRCRQPRRRVGGPRRVLQSRRRDGPAGVDAMGNCGHRGQDLEWRCSLSWQAVVPRQVRQLRTSPSARSAWRSAPV